jgi:Uma2 family endonuclease
MKSEETALLTIEEFERLPDDGWRAELVRGQVVREPPAGFEHGWIGVRISDLAVEIVSPSDTAYEVHGKVMDYLDAGTRVVWVVEPGSRSDTVYRSRDETRLLKLSEVFGG